MPKSQEARGDNIDYDHLIRMLNQLKLTPFAISWTACDETAQNDLTSREALSLFCEREISRKDERRIEMATGRLVANGEAVPLLGSPGVSKTHPAVAIGQAAIIAGYTVMCTSAPALVA